MPKQIILITAAVAVLVIGVVAWRASSSCDAKSGTCDASSKQAASEPKASRAEQIGREVQAGALLVDVREPDEYAAGHAKDAINVPVGDIQAGTYPTQDKDATVYVYCRSGKRAAIAVQALKDAGYTHVSSLDGLADWQAMGGKVV